METNPFYDLLVSEQKMRPQRQATELDPVEKMQQPQWVLAERRALLAKVNELRAAGGRTPVSEDVFVRKAEWLALGHCDYTSKLALYARDLVHLNC